MHTSPRKSRIFQLFAALILALVGGAACCSPPVPVSTPPASGPEARAVAATVMLLREEPEIGEIVSCAGAFVGQNQILTARHCICDEEAIDGPESCATAVGTTIYYLTHDAWQRGAHYGSAGVVAHVSAGDDWAVIRTYASAPAMLELAPELPDAGDRVFAVGHPRSGFYAVRSGRVLSMLHSHGEDLLAVQIEVWRGASGGPLCDSRGRVLGVASVMLVGDGSFAGYAPVAELQAWLAS